MSHWYHLVNKSKCSILTCCPSIPEQLWPMRVLLKATHRSAPSLFLEPLTIPMKNRQADLLHNQYSFNSYALKCLLIYGWAACWTLNKNTWKSTWGFHLMEKLYQHETKLHNFFFTFFIPKQNCNDRFKTRATHFPLCFPLCTLDINQKALHKITETFWVRYLNNSYLYL